MTKNIEVPNELQSFTPKQLQTFLRRGHQNVTYRQARNERIKVERKEYDDWKASR